MKADSPTRGTREMGWITGDDQPHSSSLPPPPLEQGLQEKEPVGALLSIEGEHVDIPYYGDPSTNAIGWCSRTHNLFRGCSRCGPECDNCYAIEEALHQQLMRPSGVYKGLAVLDPDGKPDWTGVVVPAARDTWVAPFETRKRWLVFANSMADVFHDKISDELVLHFLRTVFKTPWHEWQALTKRHSRMRSFMRRLYIESGELMLADQDVPEEQQALIPNLWLGVTAGTRRSVDTKLPCLLAVKAGVRWVSVEPLLEPATLKPYVEQLDWVVVGGESAGRDGVFRPMNDGWARTIRDECIEHNVPYWFKQRSGLRPERMPKDLEGKIGTSSPGASCTPSRATRSGACSSSGLALQSYPDSRSSTAREGPDLGRLGGRGLAPHAGQSP